MLNDLNKNFGMMHLINSIILMSNLILKFYFKVTNLQFRSDLILIRLQGLVSQDVVMAGTE